MRIENDRFSEEEKREDFLKGLIKRKELLTYEMTRTQMRLDTAPEGTLRSIKHGKSYQYFQRTAPTDTSGHYIKKKDVEVARKLAQKAYDQRFLHVAEKQISLIEEFTDKLTALDIEKIYSDFPFPKKILIHPFSVSEEEFVKNWLSRDYSPGFFPDGYEEYYTENGERVHSKSEIIIANLLKSYNVPYRYEYPLVLSGKEKRPDFMCLNVRKRKTILWEHFGMMDRISYAIDNVNKINLYNANGYWDGDNAIFTFETSQTPIDIRMLKKTIEKYLL